MPTERKISRPTQWQGSQLRGYVSQGMGQYDTQAEDEMKRGGEFQRKISRPTQSRPTQGSQLRGYVTQGMGQYATRGQEGQGYASDRATQDQDYGYGI
jgi:hypothetical protein